MRYELVHGPGAGMVRAWLEPGEAVQAESGAMVAVSGGVVVTVGLPGGIGKALSRALGGEGAVRARFVAERGPGEVLLAPALPGDVAAIDLRADAYLVASGAFLAATEGLALHARSGLKRFQTVPRAFMMRVTGEGTLFVGGLGAIVRMELASEESLMVDTGHLLAFSDTMAFETRRAPRHWLGLGRASEGVAAEFSGPGVLYIGSRSLQALAAALAPPLRPKP